MSVLRVELVSPERVAYSGEAKMVIARTIEGELDDIPEQAFLNVGGVEQVLAKAKALQAQAG